MHIDDAALAESLRRLTHSREDNGSVVSALEVEGVDGIAAGTELGHGHLQGRSVRTTRWLESHRE